MTVPGRGTLVAFAKGIKRTQKTVAARGSVKLPVIPKGKLAKRLKKNGKARVTVKVTYTPTDGNPRTKHKKITLEAA